MSAGDSSIETDAPVEELYDDAPCGFVIAAPDGTIRHANRTFLAWIGRPRDEVVGNCRFVDLLPAGAKIYYETHYAPLLQMQGSVREIALELVRRDAARLPVLVNATLKRGSSGEPTAMLISVFDASDRRRYERELLEARSQAEQRAAAATALEHVSDAVVLVDEDDRIRLLNRAAERLLDITGADADGLPLSSVVPDWRTVRDRVPVSRNGEPTRPAVIPLTAAGDVHWVAAAAESAPEGIVYTLRDVTEERAISQLRDDIVSIVSHELRTPLSGVYGAAETLRSLGDRLDENARAELLALIVDQSERLTRVIEQVVATERLDEGGVKVERRVFDVAETIARLLETTRLWDGSRIVHERPSEPVRAEGDPAHFEQILVNLLDNAFKYGARDTDVRIETTRTRASARVAVSNAGTPIPPEARVRIFEKFFRIDPAQAAGAAGTGLGLYIARELATRMRGRVDLVDGDADTTFAIDLPLAP